MSQYHQSQPQEVYPPTATSYPPATVEGYPQAPYGVPPPPGYPMKDAPDNTHNPPPPVETQSRGDGFWKGCCAALCCCCLLDACF